MPPLTTERSTHAAIPTLETSADADAQGSGKNGTWMHPWTEPSTSKALASCSQPEMCPSIEPTPSSQLTLPPSSNSPVEVYRTNASPSLNLSATFAVPSTSTTNGSASVTFRVQSTETAVFPAMSGPARNPSVPL